LGCFACRGELYRLPVGGVQGNSSGTVKSIDRVGDLAPQERGTNRVCNGNGLLRAIRRAGRDF